MANNLSIMRRELNRTHEVSGFVEQFHGPECFGMVEQLGLLGSDQITAMLADPHGRERPNKNQELLIQIILAKMAGLEGNLRFAQAQFLKLFQRTSLLNRESARENGLAYLEYEYSEMLFRSGDGAAALLHLERALQLARSNKLKHMIDYQVMERDNGSAGKPLLRTWLQHIAYFTKYGMTCMEVQAQFDLARHYLRIGEISEAAGYLEAAHVQAGEMGYKHLLGNIELSRVEVLIQQDRVNEALAYLETLRKKMESPQHRVRVLGRLAQLRDEQGEAEAALELGIEAVELSHRFNITAQLVLMGILVGRIYHRRFADITKSFFYYQKAYGAVQDLLQLGFPIQAELAECVTAYVTFLEEHFPGEVDDSANEDLFAFSRGLTWVRIKDLFHYNLFLYHYMNTGVGARTLEVLDFPASSFYSATERLRARGITFPNFRKSEVDIPGENYVEGLQQYCRMHREMNWVDINDRFEKDMLAYHYKVNNYNKKLMAKKLGLAYSGIVNRTQYLTSGKS